MRLLIQRVKEAQVLTDKQLISEIKSGLLIFCGIAENEQSKDLDWLANKVLALRIFADKDKKMNLSVQDVGGEVLVISQFTLFASTKKGNRPSFHGSAKGREAKNMYDEFCNCLASKMKGSVRKGIFGADMQVCLVNDGPVTLWLDSQRKE